MTVNVNRAYLSVKYILNNRSRNIVRSVKYIKRKKKIQREISRMKFATTIESFGDEMSQYDFLIPSLAGTMENVINQLVRLEEPYINLTGLNTLHFTDNYREELFEFQKSIGHHTFATRNKIGDGYAQVVYVGDDYKEKDLRGYHIFFDKLIPATIVIAAFCENNSDKLDSDLLDNLRLEKNKYLRMVRHELAHVEDKNNQKKWLWMESAFKDGSVSSIIAYDAYRIWEEYYACRRSNFYYDTKGIVDELSSLFENMTKAEKEICDFRWKYNCRKVGLNEFVQSIHEYIRMVYIYCSYFMGHYQKVSKAILEQLSPNLYSSRFYSYFGRLWNVLSNMGDSYPEWEGIEVFEDLSDIVLDTIHEFEVYPEDTAKGPYYDIPPEKLSPRK